MFTVRVRYLVHAMSAVGVASVLAGCTPPPKLEVVLWSGAVAPDGTSQYLIELNNPASIQGDYISLTARLSNSREVLVVNKKGGETKVLAETGMTTPTEHTFRFLHNQGGPVLNASGTVAHPLDSHLSINPNAATSELIAVDFNEELRHLISSGDIEPSADGAMYLYTALTPSINSAGQVAAAVNLTNTSGGGLDNTAIYRIEPVTGEVQEIVRKGNTVPNEQGQFVGTAYQSNGVFYNPYIAEDGSVAFSALIINGVPYNAMGIYIGDGTDVVEVTRTGRTLPGNHTLVSAWGLDYAANGLLAFTGNIAGDSSQDSVFLYDGSVIAKIMDFNDTAPNGDNFRGPSRSVKVSNNGKVAFLARLYQSGKTGMFVGDVNGLTQVVLQGENSLEDHGVHGLMGEGSTDFSMSDNGLVAFEGRMTKDGQNHRAIYFYDGNALQEVISTFDSIEGSLVAGLELAGRTDAQAEGINDAGDILFKFALADGRKGIAVWRRRG